ncbi:MAG: hypothetical protein DME86_04195 [Verrucomicrobia bacterium]|nr:MAG: hypothetical protein DME86_04195 [Verrucomicrobiota bacterium]
MPIGDGMVPAFFTAPDAAACCAIEIPRTLHQHPATRLRMGIHCGPVTAVTDANEHANVAGGGINIAQRVMDPLRDNPRFQRLADRVVPPELN